MLRLAEIIFRGRKKKGLVQPEKPQEVPQQAKAPAPAKAAPVEQEPTPAPAAAAPKEKATPAPAVGEVSAPLEGAALEDLIKKLEMTYEEKEDAYYIGKLAYLQKDDLRGINPVMAAKRIEKAIAQTLIENYQAEPKEVQSLLQKYRKKFKNFGTTLYVRSIKDKMSGPEESEKT